MEGCRWEGQNLLLKEIQRLKKKKKNYSLTHYVNLFSNWPSYNGISTCESSQIHTRPTVLLTARKQTRYNSGWLKPKAHRKTWLQYKHCLSSISDTQSVPESALVLHARVPEALQESPHIPGLPALGCFHFCFIERCAHSRYISFESIRLWFDLSNESTIIKVSATIIHGRSTTIFALPAHRFLKSPNVKQDRQGTYNVTIRRVPVTIVPVGKQ